MTLNINRTTIRLALFLVVAAAVVFGFAKDPADAKYNPATVVRIAGVVSDVQNTPSGVRLTIKNEEGTFQAYIGPASFLSMLKTSFANGDKVKVTGSKLAVGDVQVILVREITKKDVTITLREDTGAPVWENWGVPVG